MALGCAAVFRQGGGIIPHCFGAERFGKPGAVYGCSFLKAVGGFRVGLRFLGATDVK